MATSTATALGITSLEVLTDEEVVGRVLAGDGELFETLMRRHNRRLFRVARSIVQDDAEAEDVIQDAYVRAYTHLNTFAGRSTFATWLTRIAVHEALSRKRRAARIDGREAEEVIDRDSHRSPRRPASPEQQAIDRQWRDLIEEAIDQLPLHYRMVFVMRDVQGLDTAETADTLGIKQQAVKTRLHRARNILKNALTVQFETGGKEVFNFLGERCDRVVANVMWRITNQQS